MDASSIIKSVVKYAVIPGVSYVAGLYTPILIRRHLSISNRDKRLYQEFIELLPENRGFIPAVNTVAPGDWYRKSDLDVLDELCQEWKNESRAFDDKSIQSKMNAFMEDTYAFYDHYLTHSIINNNCTLIKIDKDYLDEFDEKRIQLHRKTNSLAQNVFNSYQAVLKSCRKLEGRSFPFPLSGG